MMALVLTFRIGAFCSLQFCLGAYVQCMIVNVNFKNGTIFSLKCEFHLENLILEHFTFAFVLNLDSTQFNF